MKSSTYLLLQLSGKKIRTLFYFILLLSLADQGFAQCPTINYKSGLQGASSNTVTIRQAASGESFEKPQSNLQEKLQY